MRFRTWNDWIVALSLVHFGQQLGSTSQAAKSIFNFLEMFRLFISP